MTVMDAASRAAFLVFLLAVLGLVSWATVFERRAAATHAEVEPVFEAAPAPSVDAPRVPVPPSASGPALGMPVQGVSAADLRDNFHDKRGKRTHRALDIMAKRGTPVIAAGDGRVAKIYHHPLGGLCVYQYDAHEEYAYYYAHLDAFAPGLEEGAPIKRGDPIGFVGTTGNASPTAPHLHFALIKLGNDRKWYKGTPVNPYPRLVAAD